MKLKGTIPSRPKQHEMVGYAWNLFNDHLDKKTIWYDSQDPEKEKNEAQLFHFSRAKMPDNNKDRLDRLNKIL